MIDNEFSGLILKHEHLQYNVLIVYKFRRIENGKYILVAEGVKEKTCPDFFLRMGRGIGTLLGRNKLWKRRKFEVISEAPPNHARTMPQVSDNHVSASKNKRVWNICCNVDAVVPGVAVNLEKMTSPPRKEESPQAGIKSKDYVRHKEVNSSKRVRYIRSNDDAVVPCFALSSGKMTLPARKKGSAHAGIKRKNYVKHEEVNPSKRARYIRSNEDAVIPCIALSSGKMTLPSREKESAQASIKRKNYVKNKEVNPSKRKAINGDTTLAGSPRAKQQMKHIENDHLPNSPRSLSMDRTVYAFLFAFALVSVFIVYLLRQ